MLDAKNSANRKICIEKYGRQCFRLAILISLGMIATVHALGQCLPDNPPAARICAQDSTASMTTSGGAVNVPIILTSSGNLELSDFAITYDATKLQTPKCVSPYAGTSVSCNVATPGTIRPSAGQPDAMFVYPTGTVTMFVINFSILTSAAGTTTIVGFSNTPPPVGSDPNANPVTINLGSTNPGFTGAVTIPAPTAAFVSLGGVVTGPEGRGVGGVVVKLEGGAYAKTITDAQGRYLFDGLDVGFYVVTPSRVDLDFSPRSRSVSVLERNADAAFTASPNNNPRANPVNTVEYFVRQQYLDFLGREPDLAGYNYWTGQLQNRLAACVGDGRCEQAARTQISAAFFIESEFQESGGFVLRLYRAGLGRQISYAEFDADRVKIAGGKDIDASKAAFSDSFVERTEFVQKYGNDTSADIFVDALLATVAQSPGGDTAAERSNLIAKYAEGSTTTQSRSLVLRAVADNDKFRKAVYNASFVAMQYFGYLKREMDQAGYDFWLNVLDNRDPNNYRGMVCSFITSAEYQRRFGVAVIHSNAECSR